MPPEPRVLVVEDDAALRETVVLALAAAGHPALPFPNGAEVLAWLAEHSGEPCLLLLDLLMPVLDGWTTLHLLRDEAFSDLRVIITTARLTAVRPGGVVVDIIRKPFTLERLTAAVARHAPRASTLPSAERASSG